MIDWFNVSAYNTEKNLDIQSIGPPRENLLGDGGIRLGLLRLANLE